MTRLCSDWLQTLKEYVEDTESPRRFWLWSGLFTLGSALQRRVWLPFGLENIYPNHYILVVAPPGWTRKGAPAGFAKRILEDIEIPVGIDSPTKRHLTKKLHVLSEKEHFFVDQKRIGQAPLALVSKELGSFFAVDPAGMITALTDLHDSPDKWDYGTSGKGEDILRNVCITCYFCTTPDWIAHNLPEGTIGGGWSSRYVIITGLGAYKEVSWPAVPDPKLYNMLKKDLETIAHITGEFKICPEAKKMYDEWYSNIKPWADSIGDPRLYYNFSRVHVQLLRTAMTLHISKSDDLLIEPKDVHNAIRLLKDAYETATDAFAGHGKSPLAVGMDKVIKQTRDFGTITMGKLLKLNYRDLTRKMLIEILENLESMNMVKCECDDKTGTTFVSWIGRR